MDILRAHAAIQSVGADGRLHVVVEVEWPERLRQRARASEDGLPQVSTTLVAEGRATIRAGAGAGAGGLYMTAKQQRAYDRAERKRLRAERRAQLHAQLRAADRDAVFDAVLGRGRRRREDA